MQTAAEAAVNSTTSRRATLNERLLGWSKLFVGGIGAQLARWGLIAAGVTNPWITVPLLVGGGVAEFVGGAGIIGNTLKRLSSKNR